MVASWTPTRTIRQRRRNSAPRSAGRCCARRWSGAWRWSTTGDPTSSRSTSRWTTAPSCSGPGSGTLFRSADGAFVAVEVDGYDTTDATAWSVVVRGVAHEVYELDDAIAALRLPLFPWHEGPKPRVMRVHPDSVSGRRFAVHGGHRVAPPT